MKKIIFACDGKNFPKGAFEFIKELHQTEPVLLIGAFLHAMNFEEFIPAVFRIYTEPLDFILKKEAAEYEKNIALFEELCQRNGIEYKIHKESNTWHISDLEKETRYADIMVMSENLFCTDLNIPEPNAFMQQALRRSECPVWLIPE